MNFVTVKNYVYPLKNQIAHINTKMKIYKIPSLTIIDICWKMSQTFVYACVLLLLLLLSRSVVSDSVWPHRRQPTRIPRPWDSPGKNTGVGCHFLLQCRKVKSESEVAQPCPTPSNPMDCSLPGSSIHGIFQARLLEWVDIAFSAMPVYMYTNSIVRYLYF